MNYRAVYYIFAVFLIWGTVTGCANNAQTGAAIGALGGAALGGQIGPHHAHLGNALIGSAFGMALGYIIGNEQDKYDEYRFYRTLEYNRPYQTSTWVNPETGWHYSMTPTDTYVRGGRVYRDVRVISTRNGRPEVQTTRMYRDRRGYWRPVR